MAVDTSPDAASMPFRRWKAATAALRAAEAQGAPHAQLIQLSEEVIKTRNLLTADWVVAGLELPEDLVRHFTEDAALLTEPDDTTRLRPPDV